MLAADGTQALVELENRAPAALFETFAGSDIHIWPYLRWPLAQSMMEIEFGHSAVSTPVPFGRRLIKLFTRFAPNPWDASHTPASTRVLYVVAGRTQAEAHPGLKNWLVDDFALLDAERSAVVQYRNIDRFSGRDSRPTFAQTFSFHSAEVRGDIAARLKPISDAHRNATVNAIESLYAALEFDVDRPGIAAAVAKVLRHQARISAMRREYERLLDRTTPELIVMDGASYGGSRAIQVRIAKERGIPVAELQHGWIGTSHGAYNFGAAMSRPELQQYLPDALLTFGTYWSEGVSTPSTTIAIGKPHLETLAKQAQPVADRPKSVLVISSAHRSDELIELTRSIRLSLPADWSVIFRAHPSERTILENRYGALLQLEGVTVDRNLDVYESLATVRAVFGESSTVLFEALAFGCHTFAIDSNLVDLYMTHPSFAERISNRESVEKAAMSLLESASEGAKAVAHSGVDEIWKPGALESFRRYVAAATAASPNASTY